LESFVDGTESALNSNDSDSASKIKSAIQQEKNAEKKAVKAEEQMKNASDSNERKLAKKKLNKA
jgi:hypothetical protein